MNLTFFSTFFFWYSQIPRTMRGCAPGCGRGGCAMARLGLTASVLLLAPGWAGAEQAKPSGESAPPAVTLRTLITGTCQEIQRYAESVVGSGVIRSVAEVQRKVHHTPHRPHCCLTPTRKGSPPLLLKDNFRILQPRPCFPIFLCQSD